MGSRNVILQQLRINHIVIFTYFSAGLIKIFTIELSHIINKNIDKYSMAFKNKNIFTKQYIYIKKMV
jgi:hypothetical protein